MNGVYCLCGYKKIEILYIYSTRRIRRSSTNTISSGIGIRSMSGQSKLSTLSVSHFLSIKKKLVTPTDKYTFYLCTVLAQRGFFKDSAFINYLKYLLYWKEPEYARFLKYPMCLYFLDLLQYEHFRREIVNAQCAKFIDDQAILLWQHYTRRRTKLFSMHNGVVQMEPNPVPASTSNNQNGTTSQQNGVGQKV